MKILVTGAAGRLGSVVCRALLERGHHVLATDLKYGADLGVQQRLADLRDPLASYALLEGQDALVHLGNIPNLAAGASPQIVFSDNTTINVNVFRAALDVGIRRIVFASSIQAMIRLEEGTPFEPPYGLPYFPLDGEAPADPGYNLYGLSKEAGERLLRVLSERFPDLACTALRYPFLAGEQYIARLQQPLLPSALNFQEGLMHLTFSDAAEVTALAVERQAPGYHQYLPAQGLSVEGYSPAEVLAAFFPGTPLRRPLNEIGSLAEISALERDLGFRPSPPLTVRLYRP